MKSARPFFLLLVIIIVGIPGILSAQSPPAMSYQAVIRDAAGELLVDKPVGMRMSILQGSVNGMAVFSETHQATTNTNGLASLVIGDGERVSGQIESINWAQGPYFLKTETDLAGGNNYTVVGTSQLLSVPYALYAANGLNEGEMAGELLYWNGTKWISLSPGQNGLVLTLCDGLPMWTPGGLCEGRLESLDCGNVVLTGSLTRDWPINNVYFELNYEGGNGGVYNGKSVGSTGVNGLIATLNSGFFSQGSGTLRFDISGTPTGSGIAYFQFEMGGKVCTIQLEVADNGKDKYPEGSVFCLGLPTQIVDVFSASTGKIWMDRNLGADRDATSWNDTRSYGDLYQWGRFADGHQCRLSPTTTELSSSDTPLHGKFIITNVEPFDWRSPGNDDLWYGVNGVNNPCPTGYRVPSAVEWYAELLFWNSNNGGGAIESPLKLPLADYRLKTNGEFNSIYGIYWSNTVSGSSVNCLVVGLSFAVVEKRIKADGNSVRCIKD